MRVIALEEAFLVPGLIPPPPAEDAARFPAEWWRRLPDVADLRLATWTPTASTSRCCR
jgi:hypothetical protein